MNWLGMVPPLTSSTNSKPDAARQRLDAQEHLAELAGAAGLLLVAVVALGRHRHGLAVGDARRPRVDLEAVDLAQPLEQHAQVQLAQAVDDGLVGGGHVLQPQARVLVDQLAEDFPHALLVAMPLGLDREAVHRHRKIQRRKVHVIVLGRVVQHGVEMDLVDLGHRRDVARQHARHLHVVLALQHEQVAHLEGLAAVADVELAVARERALVHAEDAHLADIGVDRDLEHVRQHVPRRVGPGLHRLGIGALADDEVRRVGLGRVGQQLDDHVQQFGHAGAAARGDEAHRDQVPLAQRLLERRVQLGRIDVALFEVAVDESRVDLDHLLDQRAVRRFDGAEIGLAEAVEEAVHHLPVDPVGQVQRQAFAAEGGLDVGQQTRQRDALGVDLVDDDHAREMARGRVLHHAHRHRLDAGRGIDDHRRRFDRFQRRQALAEEVGAAGRVDEVDARAGMRQVHHRGVERVLHAPLDADRGR